MPAIDATPQISLPGDLDVSGSVESKQGGAEEEMRGGGVDVDLASVNDAIEKQFSGSGDILEQRLTQLKDRLSQRDRKIEDLKGKVSRLQSQLPKARESVPKQKRRQLIRQGAALMLRALRQRGMV